MLKKKREFAVDLHDQDTVTGITYASHNDKMKAVKIRIDNIGATKALKKEIEEYKKQVSSIKEENATLRKKLSSTKKELELMYLQAIGNAETVKQVEIVLERYKKSETWLSHKSNMHNLFFNHLVENGMVVTCITEAAATKIKRINRRYIIKKCNSLGAETSDTNYAYTMMGLLQHIANIEADGTKIIEARKLGLAPLSVFKSILSAHNVKQDEVM